MTQKSTDAPFWDYYWKGIKLPITVNFASQASARTLRGHLNKYLTLPTARFLEVGCGTSKWLIHIYETFGYNVHGLDYSAEACTASAVNLSIMAVPGKIVRGDILNSPFKDDTFDVIFNGGLIEHFTDPALIITKMADLLRVNGYLITTIPNIESIYWSIQKVIDKQLYNQHYKIPIEALHEMYGSAGLIIDVIRYIGCFDLFAIDWSRLRDTSTLWRNFGMPIVGKFNGIVNYCFSKMSIEFTSKLFSPFILGIGHRA